MLERSIAFTLSGATELKKLGFGSLTITTVRVGIPVGARVKVANDLGLGGDFRRLHRLPPPITTN